MSTRPYRSEINTTSFPIMPGAQLVADTGLFFAPLDASANYVQVPALGTYLGATILPPSLTTVINYQDNVGNVYVNPAPVSAAFEINSTRGAFLMPRMTAQQRDALIPTNGMQIYNTTADEVQFFETSTWIGIPSAGVGDVTFVPPVPTADGNIPVFNGLTGLFIRDSTVNIAGGVSTATPNLNPVVGNQFSNLSILEFVTETNNTPDCWFSVERKDTVDTVYLARLFRNDGASTAATMVFSNSISGVTSSSPAAILELQSPVGGPPSVFLNARANIQSNAIPATLNVDGMQFYESTTDTVTGRPPRMLFRQRGVLQAFNASAGAQNWAETIVQGSSVSPVTYSVQSTSDCFIACIVPGVTPQVIQINLPYDLNAQGGVFVVSNISTPGGTNIIQVFVGGKTAGPGLGTSSNGSINGQNIPITLESGFDSWIFYCQTADGTNADYTTIGSHIATPTLAIRDVTGLRTVPVALADYVVNITDTGAGATTVQLPPAARTGESFVIKDGGGSAGTNNITIDIIAGGGTIDGSSTAVINTNYGSLTFVSDGTNYYVI